MYNSFKIIALLAFLCFGPQTGSAQLSVSYYSSSASKMGLAYHFNSKWWSELRLYTNTILDDLTPELVVCYNVRAKEKHNVYIGFGANVNFFYGVVVPIGVQFSPFEKLDRFSFHIEAQPTFDIDESDWLQGSVGLRYKLGNPKD